MYTQKAQNIYAGIDEHRWFDANHNFGVILMHQGKYADAKRTLQNTLAIYITSKTNQKLASVYEDLGTLAYLHHDDSVEDMQLDDSDYFGAPNHPIWNIAKKRVVQKFVREVVE